jgi:hypothetical protein
VASAAALTIYTARQIAVLQFCLTHLIYEIPLIYIKPIVTYHVPACNRRALNRQNETNSHTERLHFFHSHHNPNEQISRIH